MLPDRVGADDVEAMLADLPVTVLTSGRERTAAEFEQLLTAAGRDLASIRPTGTGPTVLESAPAPSSPTV